MPVLKLSDKPKPAPYPIFESKIPKPEELIVLNKQLLDATVVVGKLLDGCAAKWAVGGDVAEVISGVNVKPDHLTIITDKASCVEIEERLSKYRVEPSHEIEKKLDREAKVDFKLYDIRVKSYMSRFDVDGSRVDVHGDLQIKVGDWDWGDPIDFEPDYVYVVGVKVPIIPLKLKSELYSGLGWTDRVSKIHEAVMRSRHMFG